MSVESLKRIMVAPKNSLIIQYQTLFGLDGVELTFDDDALLEIAQQTIERKTGARGLRSVLERVLNPLMFTVPSDKTITAINITKSSVLGDEPVITRGEQPKAINS